ncbi:hypothetical protein Tco_0504435, partial [Tanacetum coccineum]
VAFEGIKEQISEKSCDIFFKVAFQCGEEKDGEHVSGRLEKALEAQARDGNKTRIRRGPDPQTGIDWGILELTGDEGWGRGIPEL